jgi:hypothetical protein
MLGVPQTRQRPVTAHTRSLSPNPIPNSRVEAVRPHSYVSEQRSPPRRQRQQPVDGNVDPVLNGDQHVILSGLEVTVYSRGADSKTTVTERLNVSPDQTTVPTRTDRERGQQSSVDEAPHGVLVDVEYPRRGPDPD